MLGAFIKIIQSFSVLALLSSCLGGGEGRKPVEVLTKGIFDPVKLTVDGEVRTGVYDMDEFLKAGDPRLIEVKIENRSGYPVFDIKIEFINPEIENYNFALDDLGKNEFPGMGGNCPEDQLPSGNSCIVMLSFESITSGQISQNVRIKYKNIIDPADEIIQFTVYSGDPASLVFVPDQMNYKFGTPTGRAQVPMVERSQPEVRRKDLTVTNAGELRARNLHKALSEKCVSKEVEDKQCPDFVKEAFEIVSYDCPDELERGEICHVSIEYLNKNQHPNGEAPFPDPQDQELEKRTSVVSYTANLRLPYERDPHKSSAGLNAYFASTSANIKARFSSKTEILQLGLEGDPAGIIQGNRQDISFKIVNDGYRSGRLLEILIDDPEVDSGGPEYVCKKEGSEFLNCYKESTGELANLKTLPITFLDSENCMLSDWALEEECVFKIRFQPSASWLDSKFGSYDKSGVNSQVNYDIYMKYDSRYLDQEDIQFTQTPFKFEGRWRSKAMLVGELNMGRWEQDPVTGQVTLRYDSKEVKAKPASDVVLTNGSFIPLPTFGLENDAYTTACKTYFDENEQEVGAPVFINGVNDDPSDGANAYYYENYQGGGEGLLYVGAGSSVRASGEDSIAFTGCSKGTWKDFGRKGLFNENYYNESKVSIQLKITNEGQSDAKGLVVYSNKTNQVFPSRDPNTGDTPVTLEGGNCTGGESCPLYEVTNQCQGTLKKKQTCYLKIDFYPIARGAEVMESKFFDNYPDTPLQLFKSFKVAYHNQSYLGDNFEAVSDEEIGNDELHARFYGVLVSKGVLGTIQKCNNCVEREQDTIAPEYGYKTILLTNVGSGPITRIELLGESNKSWFDPLGEEIHIVEGSNPDYLGGAASCVPYLDQTGDLLNNDSSTFDPSTYPNHSPVSFPPSSSCFLTFKMRPFDDQRKAFENIEGGLPPEAQRFIFKDIESLSPSLDKDSFLWPYGEINVKRFFNFVYYDSDYDPENDRHDAELGYFKQDSHPIGENYKKHPVLAPTPMGIAKADVVDELGVDMGIDVQGLYNHFVYRPAYSLPPIEGQAGENVERYGFAQSEFEALFLDSFNFDPNNFKLGGQYPGEGAQDALFDYRSLNEVNQAGLTAECADCSHVIYFGSFPNDASRTLGFYLENFSEVPALIDSYSLATVAGAMSAFQMPAGLPNLGLGEDTNRMLVPVEFSPDSGQVSPFYKSVLTIRYDSGISENLENLPNSSNSIIVQKFLLVAKGRAPADFNQMGYEIKIENDPGHGIIEETVLIGQGVDGNGDPIYLENRQAIKGFNTVGGASAEIATVSLRSKVLAQAQRGNEDPHSKALIKISPKNASGLVKTKLLIKDLSWLTTDSLDGATPNAVKAKDVALSKSIDLNLSGACDTDTNDIFEAPLLLGESDECDLVLTYRAFTSSSAGRIVLTVAYEYEQDHIEYESFIVQGVPLVPGRMKVRDSEGLNQKLSGNGDPTDPLLWPYAADPYVLEFSAVYNQPGKTHTTEPIEIENTSTTLVGSFLRSWQTFTAREGEIPADGDFFTGPESDDYIQIKAVEVSGSPRIKVYANKDCLFGSQPPIGSVDDKAYGFLGAGGCKIYAELILDANDIGVKYLDQNLNLKNNDFVTRNSFTLDYWYLERLSSTEQVGREPLGFIFKGVVSPDKSSVLVAGDTYTEVFTDFDANVEFKLPPGMRAVNGAVGAIDRFRVFYAYSKTPLQDTDALIGKSDWGSGSFGGSDVGWFDVPVDDLNTSRSFLDSIPGSFAFQEVYFRALAVRVNASKSAYGPLDESSYSPDEYLSEILGLGILQATIPFNGWAYHHPTRTLIELNLRESNGSPYEAAEAYCSGAWNYSEGVARETILTERAYQATRDIFAGDAVLYEQHWIKSDASHFMGLIGNPSETEGFNGSRYWFLYEEGTCVDASTCIMRKIGGAPYYSSDYPDVYDIEGFMRGDIPGVSRCAIELD